MTDVPNPVEKAIRSGGMDDGALVQAFARHPTTRPAPPAQPGREEVKTEIIGILASWAEDGSLVLPNNQALCADVILTAAEPLLARQDVRPEADLMEKARQIAADVWYPLRHEEDSVYARDRILSGDMDSTLQVQTALRALSTLSTEPASVREERLRELVMRFLADYDENDRADVGHSPLTRLHIRDFRAALSTEEPKL